MNRPFDPDQAPPSAYREWKMPEQQQELRMIDERKAPTQNKPK